MILRTRLITLFMPLAAAGLLLPMAIGACQDEGGDGGGGGTPTATTQTGTTQTGTATGTNTGVGGGTSTGTGSGGGSTCGYNATAATMYEINDGTIGSGVEVSLTGVVAMSHKFLITKSSAGNCLWGVFLSAPGLSTTEAYSGILATSYGFPAETNDAGDSYCPVPELGNDPAGDAFPDDVAPGDVLDVIGETDYFLLTSYCTDPGDSQIPQRQLSQVCSVTRTSTGAAVPTPADMTGSIDGLAQYENNTANVLFHDQWGGVKVRLTSVTADPIAGDTGDCTGGAETLTDYGDVTLNEGVVAPNTGLIISDKLIYQGLLRSLNWECRSSPLLCSQPSTPLTFNQIEGFSSMDFCTWVVMPQDKCSDYGTAPLDCPCTDPS